MIENSVVQPHINEGVAPEEQVLEFSLRPKRLGEFIGQQLLKDNLAITIAAARQRQEPIEHLLFYGPPGLGKTTLASIIAAEMGSSLKISSGPAIARAGDLAALLTNLEEGDILFIDEIHRLNKVVEEILYPAMEDRVLDIMLGKGAGARSVRMELPRFTLIGATTRLGLISNPLRDRFGHIHHLDYYEHADLAEIITRSATLLDAEIDAEAAMILARASRFTPRIANRLLKRARDFAQVNDHATMSAESVRLALEKLEIDGEGLDKNDRRILHMLITKFGGGPVGLSTMAAASGEEVDTITDVYEPFLIRQGFLVRTPKGREVTELAREHLKKISNS